MRSSADSSPASCSASSPPTRSSSGSISASWTIDPHSPEIFSEQLLCAAHEAPLSDGDTAFFGEGWRGVAEELAAARMLRERATGFVPMRADDYPAARVGLRSAILDSFALVEARSGEVIGSIDAGRAFTTVHPGAVYMHLGRNYLVADLDLEARRALLESFDGDYYTQTRRDPMIYIERLEQQRLTHGVKLSFGQIVNAETVYGYQRKKLSDQSAIDFTALEMPTFEYRTRALWYELDDLIASEPFPADALLGALHALEHGQIAVLPLIAMCDRWDIGGLSTNAHPQTGGPTIFIYDGHPGGVGLTRRGYDRFDRLVDDARRLISECRCERGCPSCVQSPKCGNLNEPLSKAGALELLRRLVAAPRA
jgi:DEAD/DEAH box helicase domain-containing protein